MKYILLFFIMLSIYSKPVDTEIEYTDSLRMKFPSAKQFILDTCQLDSFDVYISIDDSIDFDKLDSIINSLNQ